MNMCDKEQMSLVKFRVRTKALEMKEFTALEMAEVTGLGIESVRTELQRMKTKEYLTTKSLPGEPGKRGRNTVLYQLTTEEEKFQVLSRELELFYTDVPVPKQPTSRHYLLAKHLLDLVFKNLFAKVTGESSDRSSWLPVLDKVKQSLVMAQSAIGKSPKVTESFITFEKARLAYVSGDIKEAKSLFDQIKPDFEAAELKEEVNMINQFITTIAIRQQQTERSFLSPEQRAVEVIDTIRSADLQVMENNPLMSMMVEIIEELANSNRKAVSESLGYGTSTRLSVFTGIPVIAVAQIRSHSRERVGGSRPLKRQEAYTQGIRSEAVHLRRKSGRAI